MDSMDSFEFWLRRMEGKVERMSYRPSTREEASDLLDVTKVNSKDSKKSSSGTLVRCSWHCLNNK